MVRNQHFCWFGPIPNKCHSVDYIQLVKQIKLRIPFLWDILNVFKGLGFWEKHILPEPLKLSRWRHYLPLKQWEPINQLHDIKSQNNWILTHNTMQIYRPERPVQLQPLHDNAKKIKNALNPWHVLSYQETFILFHISIKSKSKFIQST
jgi:hypothetical protein